MTNTPKLYDCLTCSVLRSVHIRTPAGYVQYIKMFCLKCNKPTVFRRIK